MKKQTKQLLIFALAILLVIGWAMWPRSLERLILKHYTATDFSAIEQFNVRWTPPNAVDYAADAYPNWMLGESLTQPILEILKKATVSRPSRRNWQVIGDEGSYNLVAWCFNLHINQNGTVQVWNTNYRLDRTSFAELWAILRSLRPKHINKSRKVVWLFHKIPAENLTFPVSVGTMKCVCFEKGRCQENEQSV